jgi:hypothetical protein
MTELELQNKLVNIDQKLASNREAKGRLNSDVLLAIAVFMVGIVFGLFVI